KGLLGDILKRILKVRVRRKEVGVVRFLQIRDSGSRSNTRRHRTLRNLMLTRKVLKVTKDILDVLHKMRRQLLQRKRLRSLVTQLIFDQKADFVSHLAR